MSIPKNHHYVSQCHQEEFFNKELNKIFVYDKGIDNFYFKNSVRRLFSENHSNTRIDDRTVDQTTLEKELKDLIEDQFPNHLSKVKNFLTDQSNLQETYESLCWLTLIRILGEIRHPSFKREIDEIVQDTAIPTTLKGAQITRRKRSSA